MEFRILGPLEIREGGREIQLRGVKPRAILALLLLHANEVVSTDRIVEELWNGRPPATAVTAVQGYISQLRKALEPGRAPDEPYRMVVTRAPGYVIRVEPDELDLARFERLRAEAREAHSNGDPGTASLRLVEALTLWRGQPLADLARESFAHIEISRLDEVRLTCVEERIEADLALGRHRELVGELEALVQAHPLRESFRALLMLALYRAGRQAEALEVYRATRRALADDLGLEPSEQLKVLERAILSHDLSLEPSPPPVKAPGSILVVPRTVDSLGQLVALAESLAQSAPARDVILACVVEQAALSDTTAFLARCREGLLERGIAARAAAFTSPDPAEDVVRLATEQDVDLHIIGLATSRLGADAGGVLGRVPCDVALLVERGGPVRPGPIVVPFGAAENDWAALELGAWLARANGESLRLVGAAFDHERKERDASRLLADASLLVQRAAGVFAEPVLASPGHHGIIAVAKEAGVLVLGLSERWRAEDLGRVRAEIAEAPPAPTVFVRRGVRPGGLAPLGARTRFSWSLTAGAR